MAVCVNDQGRAVEPKEAFPLAVCVNDQQGRAVRGARGIVSFVSVV